LIAYYTTFFKNFHRIVPKTGPSVFSVAFFRAPYVPDPPGYGFEPE